MKTKDFPSVQLARQVGTSEEDTTKDYPTLYSITGDIKDINTLLVNRNELRDFITPQTHKKESKESGFDTLPDDYELGDY